jgi:hypothetical protein
VRVRRLLVGAGAVAVFASGFLPWLRFQRSELSGFRLAELYASVADEYRLGPPEWLGIAWYLLPIAAVAAWIAMLVAHPPRVVVAIHLPLGLVMLAMAVAFVIAAERTVGAQVGEVVALAGAVLVVAGAVPSPERGISGPGATRPGGPGR